MLLSPASNACCSAGTVAARLQQLLLVAQQSMQCSTPVHLPAAMHRSTVSTTPTVAWTTTCPSRALVRALGFTGFWLTCEGVRVGWSMSHPECDATCNSISVLVAAATAQPAAACLPPSVLSSQAYRLVLRCFPCSGGGAAAARGAHCCGDGAHLQGALKVAPSCLSLIWCSLPVSCSGCRAQLAVRHTPQPLFRSPDPTSHLFLVHRLAAWATW